MPEAPAAATREELAATWRDPDFHDLPEETRLHVMLQMDPDFAKMSGSERRWNLANAKKTFGRGAPPAPPPGQSRGPSRVVPDPLREAGGLAIRRSGILERPEGIPGAKPQLPKELDEVGQLGAVVDEFRGMPMGPRFSSRQAPPVAPPPVAKPEPIPGSIAAPGILTPSQSPPPAMAQWLQQTARPPAPSQPPQQAAPAKLAPSAPPPPAETPIPPAKPNGVPLQIGRGGKYSTPLSPSEEPEFMQWVAKTGMPFDPGPESDFDLRGYWRALKARDPRAVIRGEELPDEWKTPTHPTFNKKSFYAGPDAPTKLPDGRIVDSFGRTIRDEEKEKKAAQAFEQREKELAANQEKTLKLADKERHETERTKEGDIDKLLKAMKGSTPKPPGTEKTGLPGLPGGGKMAVDEVNAPSWIGSDVGGGFTRGVVSSTDTMLHPTTWAPGMKDPFEMSVLAEDDAARRKISPTAGYGIPGNPLDPKLEPGKITPPPGYVPPKKPVEPEPMIDRPLRDSEKAIGMMNRDPIWGALAENDPAKAKLRQRVQARRDLVMAGILPEEPITHAGQIAEGVGSTLPPMAVGAALGPVGTLLTGALSGADEAVARADRSGIPMSDWDRVHVGIAGGLVGSTEAAPIERVLHGLRAAGKIVPNADLKAMAAEMYPTIKAYLTSMGMQGTEEFIQEWGSNVLQDAIEWAYGARQNIDPFGKEALEAGFRGGEAGMFVDLMGKFLGSRMGRQRLRDQGIDPKKFNRFVNLPEEKIQAAEEHQKLLSSFPDWTPEAIKRWTEETEESLQAKHDQQVDVIESNPYWNPEQVDQAKQEAFHRWEISRQIMEEAHRRAAQAEAPTPATPTASEPTPQPAPEPEVQPEVEPEVEPAPSRGPGRVWEGPGVVPGPSTPSTQGPPPGFNPSEPPAAPAPQPMPSGPGPEPLTPAAAAASVPEPQAPGDTPTAKIPQLPEVPQTPSTQPEPWKGARDLVDHLYGMISRGEQIKDTPDLNQLVRVVTGLNVGADIDQKQAYDAMETALARHLAATPRFMTPGHAAAVEENIGAMKRMMAALPTQTMRTAEQMSHQQFSTPPPLAYIANLAAQIRPGETVLEPSAGTGMLAAFANAAGGNVVANELNEGRRGLLNMEGYQTHGENAEYLHGALDPAVQPSVVVMNPPFSASATRGGKNTNETGYKHVTEAVARLAPGGRLVAILGEGAGMDRPNARNFWQQMRLRGNVLADIGVSGKEYAKFGTGFGNRLIIFDKANPAAAPTPKQPTIRGDYNTVEEAWNAINTLPARAPTEVPGGSDSGGLHPVLPSPPEPGVPGSGVPLSDPVPGGRGPSTGEPVQLGGSPALPPGRRGGRGTTRVNPPATDGGRGEGLPGGSPNGQAPDTGTPAGNVAPAAPAPAPSEDDAIADRIRQRLVDAGFKPTAEAATGEPPVTPVTPVTPVRGPQRVEPPTPAAGPQAAPPAEPPSRGPSRVPAEPPPPAAKKTALDDIADQALRDLADEFGDIESDYAPPDRTSSMEAPRPAAPAPAREKPKGLTAAHKESLGFVGARKILQGTTTYKEWHEGVSSELGDTLKKIAKVAGQTPDQVLRDVYTMARGIAKKHFGVDTDELPAAAEEPKQPDQKKAPEEKKKLEDDGAFTVYVAGTPEEWGAQPHKAKMVETQSMAGVKAPPLTVKPNIDQKLIDSGALSAVQLVGISRAAEAWQKQIGTEEDGFKRAGYFIGDGTGSGKGRTIVGAILHAWNSGERRIIWGSFNEELMAAAKADFADLDAAGIPVRWLGDFGATQKIDDKFKDGVIFTTYSTLGSMDNADKTRMQETDYIPFQRVRQLKAWGGDSPVIIFDEAHKAKNAVPGEGKKPSYAGQSTIALQNAIPQAHVLYSSATGFTEPENLAYATRLGIWGPGTAFTDFQHFNNTIRKGGIGAMEIVARDLKAQGRYESRFISYGADENGVEVEFDNVEHSVTPDQERTLNTGARAWRVARENMDKALDLTNAPSKVKAKKVSQFYSSLMAFNMAVQTSMKAPTLFKIIDEALAQRAGEETDGVDKDGKPIKVRHQGQVVISVLKTGEAQQKRQLAEHKTEGVSLEDLDMSPAKILQDMIEKGFPTEQWEEYTDDDGNVKTRQVFKADGKPLDNPEAVAAKEALLRQLNDFRMPDSAIDQIVNRYGASQVAELSGRDERIELDEKSGMRNVVTLKTANKLHHEMEAFQNGKKRIAIISPASSTGISLHSSNRAQNRGRRRHIILQLMWSADEQMQVFGRTHRTDQAIPPHYTLLTMNLGGEKRFASSIARRLAQLGALSRGDRSSSGSGNISDYNYETPYGQLAVNAVIKAMAEQDFAGGVDTLKDMGLEKYITKEDDEGKGGRRRKKESEELNVKTFLNRLGMLDVGPQNEVFEGFHYRFTEVIDAAKRLGTFDGGAETIRAERVNLAKPKTVIRTDPASGAETYWYQLNVFTKRPNFDWAWAEKNIHSGYRLMRNKTSGGLAIRHKDARPITDEEGKELLRYQLYRPNGDTFYEVREDLDRLWDGVENEVGMTDWDDQRAKAGPYNKSTVHLIGGTVLPIYDSFIDGQKMPKVRIANLGDNRQRILGVEVAAGRLQEVLRSVGYETTVTPTEILANLQSNSNAYALTGGLVMERRTLQGLPSITIVNLRNSDDERALTALGVQNVIHQHRPRFYIPLQGENAEQNALETLGKVLKRFPVVRDRSGPIKFSEDVKAAGETAEGFDDDQISAMEKPTSRGPSRKPSKTEPHRLINWRRLTRRTEPAATPVAPATEEDTTDDDTEPPIPVAPSTNLPRIAINRQRIVNNLRAKFTDLGIRWGNMGGRSRNVRGFHKHRENIIRQRDALDLDTLSHELGHAVHKYIWGLSRNGDLNSKALAPFAGELGPLDYDPVKARLKEGLAEYMRLLLTEPTSAEMAAPVFHNWFMQVLEQDQHHRLRDTIQETREQILRWDAQPDAVKLGASISVNPEESTHPDDRSRKEKAKQFFRDFEYNWIDDLSDLRKATERLSASGAKVADTANAYLLARKAHASYARARHALQHGTLNAKHEKNGKGLQDILKPMAERPEAERNPEFEAVKKEWGLKMAGDGLDDLRVYLVARRMKEYHRVDPKNGKKAMKTGFTDAQLDAAIKATETPAVKKAAEELQAYSDRLLQYAVGKGALSQESVDRMFAKYEFYTPLYRVMDDQTSAALGSTSMIDATSPFMKAHGSTREAIDPLESLVRNTYSFYSYADRMEVTQALVAQARRANNMGNLIEGNIVQPVKRTNVNLQELAKPIRKMLADNGIRTDHLSDEDMDLAATIYRPNDEPKRSKGIVRVIEKGEVKLYQMDPLLIRALDQMDKSTAEFMIPGLTAAKNLLTFGATAGNPEFVLTNFIRDQLTAGLQSRNGYSPIIHGPLGLYKRLFDKELVKEWQAAGGEQASMEPMTRKNMRRSLDELTMGKKDYLMRHPKEVFSLIKEVMTKPGEFVEQATRLAEYDLARKQGKSKAEAAQDSRDVTLDFARMGALSRFANAAIPFFGVTLNSADRFVQMHRKNPKEALLIGALGVTLPTILLYALNYDDPEYESVEQWKKDLFWLIPTRSMGPAIRKRFGPFIRLPKPPIWGQFYGTSVERVMDSMFTGNPDAFDEFADRLFDQVAPDIKPAAVKPLWETESNFNTFTDRQIESPALQKYSEQYRYQPSTSKMAIKLSRAFKDQLGIDLSPVKIDHLILGYTAGLGRTAQFVAEEAVGARDDRPAPGPAEIPVVRAFATPEVPYVSTLYKKFMDRTTDLEQRQKDHQDRGAPKLTGPEQTQLSNLLSLRKDLGALHKKALKIENSTTISRAGKREQIDAINHEREDLLRRKRTQFEGERRPWVDRIRRVK